MECTSREASIDGPDSEEGISGCQPRRYHAGFLCCDLTGAGGRGHLRRALVYGAQRWAQIGIRTRLAHKETWCCG